MLYMEEGIYQIPHCVLAEIVGGAYTYIQLGVREGGREGEGGGRREGEGGRGREGGREREEGEGRGREGGRDKDGRREGGREGEEGVLYSTCTYP